jgi:hypothetical protein
LTESGLLVLEKKTLKYFECKKHYLPFEWGNQLRLNNLNTLPPRMICAKSSENWSGGSGEEDFK